MAKTERHPNASDMTPPNSGPTRFKDDVREVTNGMECGIGVATYNDIKVGDVIEAFELEESPASL